MRTEEQIGKEIAELEELKPKVRQYSAFGDDNRAAIGAQIKVLKLRPREGRIFDMFGEVENLLDAALDAKAWLDETGDAESLVEDWESLVR